MSSRLGPTSHCCPQIEALPPERGSLEALLAQELPSLPASPSIGFAINTRAVVGSITVGVTLLAPLSWLTTSVVHWFAFTAPSARLIVPPQLRGNPHRR